MAPATTGRASVPSRTTRKMSAVCMEYPEHPRIRSSSGFFADHSLLAFNFPSLDRTRHSSKCDPISSLSGGLALFSFRKIQVPEKEEDCPSHRRVVV